MPHFKITLGNGRELFAEPGETILESAKRSGFILEHSCADGRCGVCACEVISGEVDPRVNGFQSDIDHSYNRILSCQAIPLSDIEIDAEDLGEYAKYPEKTIPARISEMTEVAAGVMKVKFRTPPSNKLSFLPGQYVDVIHGATRRSYSIANAEREGGEFDIIVKKVRLGVMSSLLFEFSSLDDLFRVEGPKGTFGWRATEKENIVFLATGTGIAPIISMIEANRFEEQNIFVIWGNRYEEEFFELSDEFEAVKVVKVLSRAVVENFAQGHVQDVLMTMNLELKNTVVYACGSDFMIRDSRALLIDKGLDKKDFFSDSFLASGE